MAKTQFDVLDERDQRIAELENALKEIRMRLFVSRDLSINASRRISSAISKVLPDGGEVLADDSTPVTAGGVCMRLINAGHEMSDQMMHDLMTIVDGALWQAHRRGQQQAT